jgi:hypothetical protein
MDSIGTGFAIPEQITIAYSWLAKNQGVPVLEINESDLFVTANYTSISTVSTPEVFIQEEKMQVWVSGANELSIRFNTLEKVDVQVNLYDQLGRKIETLLTKTPVLGEFSQSKTLSYANLRGVFYVQVIAGNQVISKAIQF